MWSVLGVPETKALLSVVTFVSYVLPPVLLYFAMAMMVITPQTRTLRVASWPILVLLALRAAFSVVIPDSGSEPPIGLEILMLYIVTRSFYWALTKEPLMRRLRPANSSKLMLMDALDLIITFRGHGWDWSHGLRVPPETRPSNRIGFICHVVLSAVAHALICGILYRILRSFSPLGLGSVVGISIFDDTPGLPLHAQYFRSSIITIVGSLASYTFLQASYDVYTLMGVLLLGQDPAQWPPGFDAPWRATSLSEFWGRRWHQWLRHIFLVQAFPLTALGRPGLVPGAFLSSALFHHVGLCSLDSANSLHTVWRMLLGFGMMVPGMLAERAFRQYTGRKVGGLVGWMWTMSWLVLWGNFIIDGFVRAGMFRSGAWVDVIPPLRRVPIERLVMDFDAWLRGV